MSYVFTPSETADPVAVSEYSARLARLKPACTRCGHTLGKKELERGTGLCSNRDDCTLRAIFAGPKPPGGKGLNLGEVHSLIRYRKTRTHVVSVNAAAPALALAVRPADSAVRPADEWRPLNPYAWNPRGVTS